MAGPSWVTAVLAVVMIATAIYCAGRLAAALLWRRFTEVDTDSVHLVMGVAMAGMLLPGLSPMPGTVWEPVFGAAAAWFAYRAVRSRLRRDAAASRWRCSHPVPHLVECAAMVYMLGVLPGSWPGWPGQAMTMAGMGGGRPAAGGSLLALAVILALFMIGYVLWTADQITGPRRATAPLTASAEGTRNAAADAAPPGQGHRAGGPVLAPRLAACSKIAMGISMGYMLILML